MKKIISIFLIVVMAFCVFGCSSGEKETENSNKIESIEDFKIALDKELGEKTTKEEAIYEMIGAKDGFKLCLNNETICEIYVYDKDSDAYKKAEESSTITIESLGIPRDAIVKNGYALYIEVGTQYKDKIEEVFDRMV